MDQVYGMTPVEVVTPFFLCMSRRLRPKCENALIKTALILLFAVELFLPKEGIRGASEPAQPELETTDTSSALFPSQV